MDEQAKANLTNKSTWKRALFILLYGVFYGLAEIVAFIVIIVQFFIILVTGKPNRQLLTLGQGLGGYIYQILQFMTYNSDSHPYPFSPWPKNGAKDLL